MYKNIVGALFFVLFLFSCQKTESKREYPGKEPVNTKFLGDFCIIYGFKDASVPPDDHRSYSIYLTNKNYRFVVDSYGEIIKDTKRVSLVDTDPKSRKKLLGLVAQPTEEIMPGLVKEDAEGYKYIRYSVLVPMLLQMCQKMADKIEALEAAIEG